MKAIGTQDIISRRLKLRRFRESDIDAVYENYGSDPKVKEYVSFAPCATRESAGEFISMHLAQYESDPSFYGWAITLDDIVIGSIGLFHVDEDSEQCELGYSVGSRWWGQGYGSEAAAAVLKYGFEKMGAHRIYASHHIDNVVSGKVLTRIGMKPEGVLRDGQKNADGTFSDLKLYAELITDWKSRSATSQRKRRSVRKIPDIRNLEDLRKQRAQKAVYSKIDQLPRGMASDAIVPGCLVCEGGAFRGLYGQGVMDALMESDINMQTTIGVSAGAMAGLNYVSGQIGRSARVNLRYRKDDRYVSPFHLKAYGGVIGFDFVLRNVPGDPFDMERFQNPERRFVAVATNCETGEAEFLEKDNCSDILTAVQASASLPFVSEMVELDGKKYLDGGCAVKVPFLWAIQEGFEKIVVIRTRHRNYRYEDIMENPLALARYGNRYPELADRLGTSNRRYNEACDLLDYLEDTGRVFVISPSETWSVDRVERDMEKLGDWYWLGYHDMQKRMEELKAYLQAD